ncbi:uncharacterized protein M421DRAFT_56642, partial [Didymella exigua CBS 183.55]
HLPDIILIDILKQTEKTKLRNVPRDIELAWFLRNRTVIDTHNGKAKKGDSVQSEHAARAVWCYRLDPVRQFQCYHDTVRWNLAILIALLKSHTLNKHAGSEYNTREDGAQRNCGKDRRHANEPSLLPATVRFMTAYLAAVLEHYLSPTAFDRRKEFIRLWRNGRMDLFTIHKSWAKKALQKGTKRLGKDWERELSFVRRHLGSSIYSASVEKFSGTIIPGRGSSLSLIAKGFIAKGGGQGSVNHSKVEGLSTGLAGNELLDALRASCPVPAGQD